MENNQNKELVLLEDLGMQYATSKSKYRRKYGIYKCYCGNKFKACGTFIKSGNIKSCGCLGSQITAQRSKTHGLAKHRLYSTWQGMINRCYNAELLSYKNYGARGIAVCNEWLAVKNFINDMYPSFKEGLTIDRIDNNLNYSKDNCRWVPKTIQARNTRKIISTNTSGFRGVCWHKRNKKFTVTIGINSKNVHLGSFDDPIDAAKAYDKYIIDNNFEHTKNFV